MDQVWGSINAVLVIEGVLGEPFDPDRISLFESLYGELVKMDFPDYPDRNEEIKSYQNFAFFEGYFSNYIEVRNLNRSIFEYYLDPITNRNQERGFETFAIKLIFCSAIRPVMVIIFFQRKLRCWSGFGLEYNFIGVQMAIKTKVLDENGRLKRAKILGSI